MRFNGSASLNVHTWISNDSLGLRFSCRVLGLPPQTSELGVTEHVEGDPCKFALWVGRTPTSDNKIVLKVRITDSCALFYVSCAVRLMSDFLSLNTIGELSVVLRESSCCFILPQNLFKGKSENQIQSNPVYSPSSTFPCLSFLPASLLSCVVAWAAFRRPERLSCFTNPSSVSFDFSLCPLSVTRWQPRGPPPPFTPQVILCLLPSVGKHGDICISGAAFPVDVLNL